MRRICNGILRYSWGEDIFCESLGTKVMSKKLVICKKTSEKIRQICNFEIRHETCDECELRRRGIEAVEIELLQKVIVYNFRQMGIVKKKIRNKERREKAKQFQAS